MQRDLLSLGAILVTSLILFSLEAYAGGVNSAQMHMRAGATGGTYDGPLQGTFLSPSMDFEYEVFKSNTFSYAFRALLSLEMPVAKPNYTYFGIGTRWYLDTKGPKTELVDAKISLSTHSTWRYYVAADLGVSQAIIQTFGGVLQVVSSMVELGAGGGTIYQLNDQVGLEGRLAFTTGFGFTTVALVGVTYTGLLGAVVYF